VKPYADGPLRELVLRGRIDRVDRQGAASLLLDYKTGSVQGLKNKVAQPLEDTQLAVYAALMRDEPSPGAPRPPLRAHYLALDDSRGIAMIEHPDVEDSAAQLIEGVGRDLLDAHGGAALPALGEGVACGFCEMRGLCRRDDWSEAAP